MVHTLYPMSGSTPWPFIGSNKRKLSGVCGDLTHRHALNVLYSVDVSIINDAIQLRSPPFGRDSNTQEEARARCVQLHTDCT